MTKEEKEQLYTPKRWALYCNNEFISSYPSHNSAKRADADVSQEQLEEYANKGYAIRINC